MPSSVESRADSARSLRRARSFCARILFLRVAGLARTPCAPIAAAETRWPAMSALRTAAAAKSGIIDLATTVSAVKPTILIGSTNSLRQSAGR